MFEDKVTNAESSGAAAVIVANNEVCRFFCVFVSFIAVRTLYFQWRARKSVQIKTSSNL
jgi:hypothetical protein